MTRLASAARNKRFAPMPDIEPDAQKEPDAQQEPDAQKHFAIDWLQQYGDKLFSYALNRVAGDASVAEDLVQETLLAGLKGYDKFQGSSAVETWLISILRRKIIDRYRAADRRAKETPEQVLFDEHGSLLDVVRWDGAASQDYQNREFMQVLDQCLAALKPQLAEAFTLCVMDGLSTEEACSVLGVTPTNLSVRLHRARVTLRKLLQSRWFE